MSNKCIVVLGAGFINQELHGEFGSITSSVIPLIDRCAVVDKLDSLDIASNKYLAIHRDEIWILPHLLNLFENLQVVILDGNTDFTQAVYQILGRVLDDSFDGVEIHFVDTKVNISSIADCIAVSEAPDESRWTTVYRDCRGNLQFEDFAKRESRSKAIVGYFSIQSLALFYSILKNELLKPSLNFRNAFWRTWEIYDENQGNSVILQFVESWMDLGHIDSYFVSRGHLIRGREFNSFEFNVSRNMIQKRIKSEDISKSEISWYRFLPSNLRGIVPNFSIDDSGSSYQVELISNVTLAEALLYCNKEASFWQRSQNAIVNTHNRLRQEAEYESQVSQNTLHQYDMYIRRSEQRISSLLQNSSAIDLTKITSINGCSTPLFETLVDSMLDSLKTCIDGTRWSMIHGDFFLGNMFFDHRIASLILIDPRGSFGKIGIYGDPLYDAAKLGQSILGCYDFLAHNLFRVRVSNESSIDFDLFKSERSEKVLVSLENWFYEFVQHFNYDLNQVKLLTANLLLTCASLHRENPERQIALFASSVSLLKEIL